MDQPGLPATQTFNPWSVVNLVFHHLAEQGLHPVLGESGDPGRPAADADIRPGQAGASIDLAFVRARARAVLLISLGALGLPLISTLVSTLLLPPS